MDYSKLPLVDLKVIAYDQLAQIAKLSNEINSLRQTLEVINQEVERKNQTIDVETEETSSNEKKA